jgi:IMP dehydrogenase
MRFLDSVEYLTYDDVLLVPGRSNIQSRHEVDLTSGSLKLKTPLISANMDTITEENMAIAMANEGGMGIIHRFLPTTRLKEIIYRCRANGVEPAISVGINEDSNDLLEIGLREKIKVYCIDVAHGHHDGVIARIHQIRNLTDKSAKIIAGNVATVAGCMDLMEAGADIIKIGIGPGSHCTTRVVTGHGVPQLSALLACCEAIRYHGKESIADGGIRNSGDIAKALAAGADYVMLGKMLAGCEEAPGQKAIKDGKYVKLYRGMASREAQADRGRGDAKIIAEGVASHVPYSGALCEALRPAIGGVKSAFSYTGARNISEFREKATFIRITHNSYIEGTPHGAK